MSKKEWIKFTGIVKGLAWFSVGEKAVALDKLGTNTFFDKDVEGLNDLYSMHWGFQMDFNNALHAATKKTPEVNECIERGLEVEAPGYSLSKHIYRLDSLLKSLKDEADMMLALKAAIYVLENDPPIFVESRIVKEA